MSKLIVVVGDATTGGGQVVSGSPFTDIDGFPVARVGDKASCTTCGGVFPIASGDPTFCIDGAAVARHGDQLSCGHALVAGRQFRAFLDSQTSSAPGVGTSGRPVTGGACGAAAGTTFDEAFILRSELTGKPLANRGYQLIREDGSVIEGMTDADGTTALAVSDAPELVRVEIAEEAAHA